jgi:hypothetical protein
MSSAGTSNRSKDKIRNTQRREIVGTDIREQMIYIKTSNIFSSGVGEKVLILYMFCENKRKERVFLFLTASQLTSRHLAINPATVWLSYPTDLYNNWCLLQSRGVIKDEYIELN